MNSQILTVYRPLSVLANNRCFAKRRYTSSKERLMAICILQD